MALDRDLLVSWYCRNRARSRALFDLLAEDAYYSQPIALRHPIVFYEGHLPGFSFNTLIKKGLGHPGIDARRVAVEHNLVVLKRTTFDETVVNAGDQVEVVNFVGGG